MHAHQSCPSGASAGARAGAATAMQPAAHLQPQPPCSHPTPPLQDEDEGIAVEACEFWTAFCESEIDKDVLRPFLPRVLPVLLKNMVSLGRQLL